MALRNRIDAVLTAEFTATWHHTIRTRGVLTNESDESLANAIARTTKHNGQCHKNDVVGHLTFDFWSNLFRPEYDRSLWQKNMSLLLPNANPPPSRADFQAIVASLNKFRNRVAHHEPVLSQNLAKHHADILKTVRWCSVPMSTWLKSHSTVNRAVRTRPQTRGQAASLAVGERCDRSFKTLLVTTTLADSDIRKLAGTAALVCIDPNGQVVGVVDSADIGRYLAIRADDTGLLDFNEHTIGDVVDANGGPQAFFDVESRSEMEGIAEKMKNNKAARFALVRDHVTGEIMGVIAKAHRRY